MYIWGIVFIVGIVVMCVGAEIAFRLDMKKYKQELERKSGKDE